MIHAAFILYRSWAYEIFENVAKFQSERAGFSCKTLITTPQKEFSLARTSKLNVYKIQGNDTSGIHAILLKNKIDIAFFYGWSWIVKKPVLDDFLCMCLHPSPLPHYRGGTPIQHQILGNEKESAVTVFKMNEGIDDGGIYKQMPMSLSGNINDIFKRMTDLGTIITKDFITDFDNNEVIFTPQKNVSNYPPLKRRTPDQSEVLLNALSSLTFIEFNNLVRALTPPFPSVFIQTKNMKLIVFAVQKYVKPPKNYIILSNETEIIPKNRKIMVRLKDGFAHITDYKVL